MNINQRSASTSRRKGLCWQPRGPRATDAGFTLLEVMVVALVIGLLAAIAAPGWLSFLNARRLNASQDQIIQAMRLAQTEAIRHGAEWQASFQEQNGLVGWSIHPVNALPTRDSWQFLDPHVHIDTRETTLRRVSGIYRVQFNHKGQVNGQLGRLTLSGDRASRTKRCVMVSTLLGTLRKSQENRRPDSGGRYCY